MKIECAADKGPNEIRCMGGDAAQFEIEAQDPNTKGPPPLPKFSMSAYNGGPMNISGFRYPVVVDLQGLSIPSQSIPIRKNHDIEQGVGHTTQIDVNQNTKITAKGFISRSTPAAEEVVASGKKGFPWQSSIGASVHETEWIAEDKSAIVNGKSVKGPATIVRKSTLKEISFVDLGADTTSSANVAASAVQKKEITEMTDEEKKALEAKQKVELEAKAKADAEALQASADAEIIESRKKHAAEARRVGGINRIAAKFPDIAAKAIEEGWNEEKTELNCMRAEREELTKRAPNAIIAGSSDKIENNVLEAAMCQALGYEKGFDEKTLEAAHARFKGRLSLKQMFLECAWASGKFHGRTFEGNHRDVLEAAFSTLSLPGILSNNMNKFLLDSFNAVESTWRKVASIGNVRDFKQKTQYRLGGDMQYEKVGPHGELKNGKTAEVKYTNQIDTYGKLFALSRQDIINDDMGALAQLPRRLGRGAALKFNRVFWTVFMSNPSNYFGAGHNNFKSGAGSALGFPGLDAALAAQRNQLDPDGQPLGYPPAILLVPNALEILAMQLVGSIELRDTTASTKFATMNAHRGKYEPVQSTYLSDTTIVNNSTTRWWLLVDPQNLSVIEASFLNGQESPVVESTEADFDTLGVRFRGFHDFGVDLMEYRAGVQNEGA